MPLFICRSLSRFVLLVGLFSSAFAFQEVEPVKKWKSIPMDDLKMQSYPADSNASAVILFDVGNAKFDERYELMFTRHTRIKLLTKAGYDFATVEIPFYDEDPKQSVRDVEGMTYQLNADGKMQTSELDDDNVFEEDINGRWKRLKFTLPSLSPGCIIEYRYTVRSSSPHYLPDWTFQSTEPTLWSEYEIKTPYVFTYASVSQSYHPFHIQFSAQIKEGFMSPRGMQMMNINHARWVMKDVPAMREEPYMTTLDDYFARLSFQLSAVSWPGELTKRILNTWEKVTEELLEDRRFGKWLEASGTVRKETRRLVDGITDPLLKAEAIYDFVRRTVVWNDDHRILIDSDQDDVLEKRSGSSAEVNLLLTSMLREAGFSANPVLLSTRDNGKIQELYPIVDQFNYVICRAEIAGKFMLIDATDRLRPMTILPTRALNKKALLLANGKPNWIGVEPSVKGQAVTHASLAMTEEGALTGTIQAKYSGYRAVRERLALANQSQNDYVKSVFNIAGMTIDSSRIEAKDSAEVPLIITAFVRIDGYAQVLNDVIYLNPMLSNQLTENPFKLESRAFPVDRPYAISESYIVNLSMPRGFVLHSRPADVNFALPRNGGMYQRRSHVQDSLVQLSAKLELNQTFFAPEEYGRLRKFYEQIVAAGAEQCAIRKAGEIEAVTNGAKQ